MPARSSSAGRRAKNRAAGQSRKLPAHLREAQELLDKGVRSDSIELVRSAMGAGADPWDDSMRPGPPLLSAMSLGNFQAFFAMETLLRQNGRWDANRSIGNDSIVFWAMRQAKMDLCERWLPELDWGRFDGQRFSPLSRIVALGGARPEFLAYALARDPNPFVPGQAYFDRNMGSWAHLCDGEVRCADLLAWRALRGPAPDRASERVRKRWIVAANALCGPSSAAPMPLPCFQNQQARLREAESLGGIVDAARSNAQSSSAGWGSPGDSDAPSAPTGLTPGCSRKGAPRL